MLTTLVPLLLAVAAPRARAQGPNEPIAGHVIAVADERLDIDVGDSRLKGGDVGVIQHDGAQIGLASVIWVDVGHTSLRILSLNPGARPATGDVVVFASEETRPNAEQQPTVPAPRAGPVAGPGQGGAEDFVPLLAPTVARKTALTRTANVFHGSVRAWELYQDVQPARQWYAASRVDTDGAVERLGGRPWSLAWSGNATRRDGSAGSTAADYRRARLHLFRGVLSYKGENGGFLRAGRFFPTELAALGYLDGGQAEVPVGGGARVGAVGGEVPDVVTLDFSNKQQLGAAYATVEAGEPRDLYYSGTAGVFRTLWLGKGDELAGVLDQRLDLGPKVALTASGQADFDGGGAAVRRGARLTRGTLTANAAATDAVSVRAGANHYEPLDTAAARDLAGGTTFYLNNGFWRYWTGSAQSLPEGFSLDEDLSFTRSDAGDRPGQWRLTAGKRGLPGVPSGSVSWSVYNLDNPAGRDYGSSLTASAGFLRDRLTVDASAGARRGPTSTAARKTWLSDANAHASWRPSAAWSVDAGVSRTWQDMLRGTTVSGGLSCRW